MVCGSQRLNTLTPWNHLKLRAFPRGLWQHSSWQISSKLQILFANWAPACRVLVENVPWHWMKNLGSKESKYPQGVLLKRQFGGVRIALLLELFSFGQRVVFEWHFPLGISAYVMCDSWFVLYCLAEVSEWFSIFFLFYRLFAWGKDWELSTCVWVRWALPR